MRQLALILNDIRSAHNVGALLRTADGLGVQNVYITGYTPYPLTKDDTRLPHLSQKISERIDKTALGAIKTVNWKHEKNIYNLIHKLRADGYVISALEQTPGAKALPSYAVPDKLVLILGNEVKGLSKKIMASVDINLEIPMFGEKESFNVAAAAAMALYHCRFEGTVD